MPELTYPFCTRAVDTRGERTFRSLAWCQDGVKLLAARAPGTFTAIARIAVSHVTFLTSGSGAGDFWATFTATGDATFAPDDPSQPSASGHFTAWDGENGNLQNSTGTGTFTAVLTGTDGSKVTVHETFQCMSARAASAASLSTR